MLNKPRLPKIIKIKPNYVLSFILLINTLDWLSIKSDFKLINTLAIINHQPRQKSYRATAQFWGRLATGVKQPSTVTLYPNRENRLLVIIIISSDCGRFLQINAQKIQKVTYSCSQEERDESTNYTNWKVNHDLLTKEIKIIAPKAKNNPLYIREEAFWLIKY